MFNAPAAPEPRATAINEKIELGYDGDIVSTNQSMNFHLNGLTGINDFDYDPDNIDTMFGNKIEVYMDTIGHVKFERWVIDDGLLNNIKRTIK